MSQNDIEQLRQVEESLSQTVAQKQGFQQYIHDIDAALQELENVDEAHQIIGTIMVKKSSSDIKSDLNERKQVYSKRLEAVERQEKSLRDKVKELQQSAMDDVGSSSQQGGSGS